MFTDMSDSMTIKEQLIALGIPESEIDHHSSDLYVLKTPLSEKFVAGYQFKQNVTTFVSQIDRKTWYDIPFGYPEHYRNRK